MAARILVIEDNSANLDLMCYLLQAFGYTPLRATSGEEGLLAVQRDRPDLIICDVHLPGIDGYAIARWLKADPALRLIPLVAVTALAMVGDREKVLASGFDGYISKPITPEAFVGQVAAFLPQDQRATPRSPQPSRSMAKVPASPSKQATILVVDDSAVNRDLAESTLGFRYHVLKAASMRDGLELARQAHPDLILADLHMPEENGLVLLQAIKADPALRSIPVILISSTSRRSGQRTPAVALGAAAFLLRPIEPEALLAQITACLIELHPGESGHGHHPDH